MCTCVSDLKMSVIAECDKFSTVEMGTLKEKLELKINKI